MLSLSKALIFSCAILTLGGCDYLTYGKSKEWTAAPAVYYSCGDMPVAAQTGEDKAVRLNVGGTIYPLIATQTNGTVPTYENLEASPKISFWEKDDRAVLQIDDKTFPTCMKATDEKVLAPKNYRAIGNDPAWLLSIQDGKIAFNWHYGEKVATADLPEPTVTQDGLRYNLSTGIYDFVITITHKSCLDHHTGQYYPDQVSILFYNDKMKGCGNEIGTSADLPVKPTAMTQFSEGARPVSTFIAKTWAARQIDGQETLPSTRLSLILKDDKTWESQGGCGAMRGTYATDGKAIRFVSEQTPAQTLCAADLAKQDKDYLTILKSSTTIEVRDNTLIISTPRQKTISFTPGTATTP